MKNINYFEFRRKRSTDFGMIITQADAASAPVRSVITETVPGKSGLLLIDQESYENIEVSYQCSYFDDLHSIEETSTNLKAWLLSSGGYSILSDSYNSAYFRYGYVSNKLDISEVLQKVGSVKITFSCKPFRYSYKGDKTITIKSPTQINNPEAFASQPYIKLHGTGDITLNIGSKGWIFKGVQDYIEIDSEMMNAYKGTALQNHKMQGEGFPQLEPGWNQITFDGNVEKIEMKPRWKTL